MTVAPAIGAAAAARRAALLGPALAPLGWLFGAGTRLRAAAYRTGWLRRRRPPLPTLSIGNLAAGGTGKTPLLLDALRRLRDRDVRAGVLSRGYGGDEGRIVAERHPEALLVEDHDRVRGLRRILELGPPDVLLLDDGFQHFRLERDLDVVLLDAMAPFGRCFPAGLFREPPAALRRAHLVVLSRADLAAEDARRAAWERVAAARARLAPLPELEGSLRVRHVRHLASGETRPAETLRGLAAFVACGVGNPLSFLRLCQRAGVEARGAWFAPDHHPWPDSDLRRFRGQPHVLVTEKDGVKLRGRAPDNVWEVRADWHFTRGEEHWERALGQLALPARAARIEPLWEAHDPGGVAVPPLRGPG